jgi:hypothetical protein
MESVLMLASVSLSAWEWAYRWASSAALQLGLELESGSVLLSEWEWAYRWALQLEFRSLSASEWEWAYHSE